MVCYLLMILTCASIANYFTPFLEKKSIVLKLFISNELKVVISGILYMLIFMMMMHDREEMKVWNIKYGHRALNKESCQWEKEPREYCCCYWLKLLVEIHTM